MTNNSSDIRIAIIGDVHGFWTSVDTKFFSSSDYDFLLFTGDLGNARPGNTSRVAREISKIEKEKFLIPGNHDSTSLFQLALEVFNLPVRLGFLGFPGHILRWKRFLRNLGDVQITGYSLHETFPGLFLLGARPLSMGARFNFLPFLSYKYGVDSLNESARRLGEVIGKKKEGDWIVLAHNGPDGLGETAKDIWGCDFRKEQGDFGDSDLGDFLRISQSGGNAPKAVIAGHMHHSTRKGKQKTRIWKRRKDGILYVNAARVPRIVRDQKGNSWHHHISLVRKNGEWEAEAKFMKNGTEEFFPLPDFLEREKNRVKED